MDINLHNNRRRTPILVIKGIDQTMSVAENHKFTCQLCGCEFIPKDLNASYLKRNPPRYCSKQCRGDSRKGRLIIVCSNPNCKKLKEKRPSELKAHLCCDIGCAKEWRRVSGINIGKNNLAWRGGISYLLLLLICLTKDY